DFFKSGTGIVARNEQGQVFASRSILHSNVGSTFTAEALTCSWAVKMGLVLGVTEAIIEERSWAPQGECRKEKNCFCENANMEGMGKRKVISGK
ncbi:hypothetical protein Godav_004551, partial [Gossypium davidsonii]|nr:hypothetical protein [Gossypium davidsonii]MBA0662623.1 hypothetical protein [Gossypium klotzschianum]